MKPKTKRVTFEEGIKTLSGISKHSKEFVFVSLNNNSKSTIRKYYKTKIHEHTAAAHERLKSAARLWHQLNPEFLYDLKIYTHLFNSQIKHPDTCSLNSYMIFTKALCQATHPFDSLEELTDEFGLSLREWITNGHLNKVKTTRKFRNKIDLT
jgi:hypothetical protein